MLQTAVDAAHDAGRLLLQRYSLDRRVTIKGYRDIVTDADAAAEAVVLEHIRTRFPNHAILSEEAGSIGGDGGVTWVVDPLDGTTNYAHRMPAFAVSIGVLEEREPLLGVIYDPELDHTFTAERGRGVWLNGAPVGVSQIDEVRASLFSLDWGHADADREQTLRYLERVAPLCGTIRALGSATLALAYVAAGWLDAYLNLALKPWDTAAGCLMVAEGGGRCTAPDGAAYDVMRPGCLATNGLIHDALLHIMSDVG